MSYSAWISYISNAEKTSIISGNVRKIHYKFPDGKEMAEEYSMDTGVVQRRVWKKKNQLMGEPFWEIELGGPPKTHPDDPMFHVRECDSSPLLTKRITKKNIEWRIRNMPYPLETYVVTVDRESRCITVKTTNKKYYKIIKVPELDRCGIAPDQDNITLHHQFNTLIITYKKPKIVCDMEVCVLKELQDVETEHAMEDVLQDLLKK